MGHRMVFERHAHSGDNRGTRSNLHFPGWRWKRWNAASQVMKCTFNASLCCSWKTFHSTDIIRSTSATLTRAAMGKSLSRSNRDRPSMPAWSSRKMDTRDQPLLAGTASGSIWPSISRVKLKPSPSTRRRLSWNANQAKQQFWTGLFHTTRRT